MTRDVAPRLAAQCFDGRSARPQAVVLHCEGGELVIETRQGGVRRLPLREVQWPERYEAGPRVAHLRDGGSLHVGDGPGFDAWARASGLRQGWVARAQQSWRQTVAAGLLLLAVVAAAYVWGLPLAARGALSFVPPTVDRALGDAALDAVRERWLQPSALPAAQQQRLREAWADAWQRAHPDGPAPALDLHFAGSRIGPNAFALPGGHVVLTDEMVQLVDGREDALIGVLAHEAGHVRHRHGMRLVAQGAVLGVAGAIAFGDFSGLLASAPAVLGHLGYSRDFEREADTEALRVLQANGLSPLAMAQVFERLQAHHRRRGTPELPIALGSHPPEAERIARFRAAAR